MTALGVPPMRFRIMASGLLAGCVSAGTNFDPYLAAAVKPGTIESDAVRQLGKPNNITTGATGDRVLVWVRIDSNVLGAKSRSLAMLFSGGKFVRTISQGETQVN